MSTTRDPALPVVAIAVLDRDRWDANTDNLAVIDPQAERVVSVPRDLWSSRVGDRINQAWPSGGAELLVAALADHGFAVDAAICLRRGAVVRALADVEVTVPVDQPMAFLYPRQPEEMLQDGAIVVRFDPPSEVLNGVRIHQWLGARRAVVGAGSDLGRIRRQHTFVRALMRSGFDFSGVLADPDLVRVTNERALETLALVRPDWSFDLLDDVVPRTINGAQVLVRATARERLRHLGLRVGRRALSIAWHRSRFRVPTAGVGHPRRKIRLLAIVAVRNEEQHLPGFLEAVAPHVDGVIALDDGSTDRSVQILEDHPLVLDVVTRPSDRATWDEVDNHRLLVRAALDHGADWIMALDADERVESGFRDRVERAVRRGRRFGLDAFAVYMRELWDGTDQWRSDGVWGRKAPARLFAARSDHDFDVRPLHSSKAPNQGKRFGTFVTADVWVYHLRMIDPADRRARRERYEALDPDCLWQPVGYAYLTDESGIRLRPVPRRRRPAAI